MDRVDEFLDLRRFNPGDRRVRPHPAGVRPDVAVADALVVACDVECDGSVPVAHGKDG